MSAVRSIVLPSDDAFESITESSPLVAELRARIASDGPITFRDFMAAVLYHPRYGYYSTHADAMSRRGDYVTSPEVHPIFGSLVAKQLWQMWDVLARPSQFDVVEQGGGTGALARDMVLWAAKEPEFARAMRYQILETTAALRERQRVTINAAGIDDDAIAWLDALPQAIDGCLLSNELIDAFPVHRVKRDGGRLREVYVTWTDDGFVDQIGDVSTPEIDRYFDRLGLRPGEACFAEVNLDAAAWMTDVAQRMRRGYVLTFDYGYEAPELYASWRRDGALQCFYRQSASSDPYQRVGMQDMTSSIDFTTLRAAGEAAGLGTISMTDQSSFLVRLGIGEGVAAVAREHPEQLEEYYARRNVVLDLIDPGKLGRIKVLLQGRGVPDCELRGFVD